MSVTTISDRVKIKYKTKELFGLVKFIGEVKGKSGVYYGIEVDKANEGENNGAHQKIIYFVTNKKRGVFIKKSQILKTNSKNNTDTPRVTVGSKVSVPKYETNGVIKFVGSTTFKAGIWYGIQLEKGSGKNNGTVKDRAYFKCEANYGVFVKQNGFEISENTENEDDYVTNNYGSSSNGSGANKAKSTNNADAIERRKDVETVVNVVNGNGSVSSIDSVIKSYDDKKEEEDLAWLKIIATLKSINEKISNTQNKLKSSEQKQKQLQQQLNEANSDNNKTNTNTAELERRLKFEKDELKTKYESQIRTLNADKQRLESELSKVKASTNYVEPKQEIKKVVVNESEAAAKVEELTKEKQQLQTVVRAKDEIIANAKKEIEKLKKEIRTLKEEEEKEELQLDNIAKDRAKKLLEERVKDQQQGTMNEAQAALGKKKTITEMLNDATKDDAVNIIHSMGVIKFDYDKTLKRDTYNLDLTNNSVLRRLTNEQRKIWMFLLGHTICDKSGQQKIEKVKMSNMNIDDKVFCAFMDILIENVDAWAATEW
eukprot:CAMPEP_0201575308 /NCGR_PEP_ID=MMETSP0190_2-20130828/20419_1 /ASSEMBLY_ACC=CAM_ASM_000263 /TAXON_ID=37353 /ORGANISM="Rosalina sp." /LENGTH=541 /DNA_ID=CAMNT_0048004757 /DNA_START=12 /DNA_END=1634 /DNA_ORIENTATION=+